MTTKDKKENIATEKKIIEKTTTDEELAEYILAELIAQGLSGEKLIAEFSKKLAKVRPAVESVIIDAEKVATDKGEFYTYDDVFNSNDYE